jgi:hypothetical protein
VQALLVPPPSLPVPANFVAWSTGTPAAGNPLRTLLPRPNVGLVDVAGTIHGVVRSLHVIVVDIEATEGGTAASPATDAVRVGLWDAAFNGLGDVLRGPAEANHFVGADSRRFFLRVRDPSAAGATVAVQWKTQHPPVLPGVGAAPTDDDAPASQLITLSESAAGSRTFLSPALMLVTDPIDKAQATNSRPAAAAAAGAAGGENGPEHRLRRITVDATHVLDNQVFASYTPAGAAAPAAQRILPVFQRTPADTRRRLPLHIFVLRAAGLPVIATDPNSVLWTRDLRVIREVYARFGIAVETVVPAATLPADVVPVGGDSVVLINPPAGVEPNNVSLANQVTLANSFPGQANTLRMFYTGGLWNPALAGESFPDADFFGTPRAGCSYISVPNSTPHTPAHEIGHILTNKLLAQNGGHYLEPNLPGTLLHTQQNLMRAGGTSIAEGVGMSRRLWDANDAHLVNQFAMMGIPLIRWLRGF